MLVLFLYIHICTGAVKSVGQNRDRKSGQEKKWDHLQQQCLRSSNVLNYEFKFKHLSQLKTNPCSNELQTLSQKSLEWHSLLSRKSSMARKSSASEVKNQ